MSDVKKRKIEEAHLKAVNTFDWLLKCETTEEIDSRLAELRGHLLDRHEGRQMPPTFQCSLCGRPHDGKNMEHIVVTVIHQHDETGGVVESRHGGELRICGKCAGKVSLMSAVKRKVNI